MYSLVLTLHSFVRWIVVILAVLAVARAFSGWLGKKPWAALDDKAGAWFVISMDVQLLLGLLLYVVFSPLTTAALRDFGAAMGSAGLRYFAVEHTFLMLVAVVLAHVGRARSRRATDFAARHRSAAIFFGLALLTLLAAIPWPFLAGVGRPLLRLG